MTIIAILNPKGGCGKTTISTNLARSFYHRHSTVLLVDTDPQGSARDWHAVRDDNPIDLIALDRPNNLRTLEKMSNKYQAIIIDGAAKLEDMLAVCVKVSDCILIPVQPSPYDIWAVSDLVDLIKVRQEVMNGSPKSVFLITRVIEGTRLGKDVREALEEYGLPVLQTFITQRQVWPQTSSEGLTVFDSSNTKAIAEIEAVTTELEDILTFQERGPS